MENKFRKKEIRSKIKFMEDVREFLHEKIDLVFDKVVALSSFNFSSPEETDKKLREVEKTIKQTATYFTKTADEITAFENEIDKMLKNPNDETNASSRKLTIRKQNGANLIYTDPSLAVLERDESLEEKFSALENKIDPILKSLHCSLDQFSNFKTEVQEHFARIETAQTDTKLQMQELSKEIPKTNLTARLEKLSSRVDKLSAQMATLDSESQDTLGNLSRNISKVEVAITTVAKACPGSGFLTVAKRSEDCERRLHDLDFNLKEISSSLKLTEDKYGLLCQMVSRIMALNNLRQAFHDKTSTAKTM